LPTYFPSNWPEPTPTVAGATWAVAGAAGSVEDVLARFVTGGVQAVVSNNSPAIESERIIMEFPAAIGNGQ
jgi:hypothetical protein